MLQLTHLLFPVHSKHPNERTKDFESYIPCRKFVFFQETTNRRSLYVPFLLVLGIQILSRTLSVEDIWKFYDYSFVYLNSRYRPLQWIPYLLKLFEPLNVLYPSSYKELSHRILWNLFTVRIRLETYTQGWVWNPLGRSLRDRLLE